MTNNSNGGYSKENLEKIYKTKISFDRKTGYYRFKNSNQYIHRVIVEQMIGRKLEPNEVVHHIIGNKLDNDPSNLLVLDYEEHFEFHRNNEAPSQQAGCPAIRNAGEIKTSVKRTGWRIIKNIQKYFYFCCFSFATLSIFSSSYLLYIQG